jgi:SAM-dependent methyltransferase
MNNKSAPQIFICYAREDSTRAEQIFNVLKEIGVDPWLDKKILVPGDFWEHEIKKAVSRSDAFVVCLRPHFDKIGFRQKEIRWAKEALELRPPGQSFIIPFIIEPCEIPDWCKPIHVGTDPSKASPIEELVAAIRKHCSNLQRTSMLWKNYTDQGYAFDYDEFAPTKFELKVAERISPGDYVLDIGTGPGRFVDIAFKKGAKKVIAIDPRYECEQRILKRFQHIQNELDKGNFTFIQGEWPDIAKKLQNYRFDLVFAQSSLHYLDRDRRHNAFSRVRWCLKHTGVFALAVKSIDNAWITVGDAEKISRDRWFCKDGITRTFFTIQGLIEELRGAGFNITPDDYFSRIVEGYEWPGQLTVWHEIITII